ncbi:hypothetical protein L9F63_015429, partial [Diploptera punctata]
CGRGGHWSKECPKTGMGANRNGFRDRMFGREPYPPPPPPPFLRDRMMGRFGVREGFYDGYDGYRNRFEDSRELFERRFPPIPPRDLGPSLRGRDFLPPPPLPPRRDPLPPPPPLGLRGPSSSLRDPSSFDRDSAGCMRISAVTVLMIEDRPYVEQRPLAALHRIKMHSCRSSRGSSGW